MGEDGVWGKEEMGLVKECNAVANPKHPHNG